MKPLKMRVQVIICALRDEMLERESQGYDEIFGDNAAEFLQRLSRRFVHMPTLPEDDERKVTCRIINNDFAMFLDKAIPRGDIMIKVDDKPVKSTTFYDDHESLEILRTNIAAINVIAASGAFQDPNYNVAEKASRVAGWLARDIGFYKELAGNKLT